MNWQGHMISASIPRRRGPKQGPRPEMVALWKKVKPLFANGLTSRQIAKTLRTKQHRIYRCLYTFNGSGWQGRLDRRAATRERDEKIIELSRSPSATLESIASHFGITRERVRQVMNRLIKEGRIKEKPIMARKRLVPIRALRNRRAIQIVRGGGARVVASTGSGTYISEGEAQRLLELAEATKPKCRFCGDRIEFGTVCGVCRNVTKFNSILALERIEKLRRGEMAVGSDLSKAVVERLKRSIDCRIESTQARAISGLTLMQFNWMRWGNRITSIPTRPGATGKSQRFLYSESEMRQIAEIRKSL